jgi:hypothetical protein
MKSMSRVFGRAKMTVLAVVVALVLVGTPAAFAANGQPFILGKAKNAATKVTGLIGKVASGPALVVKNPKGGAALGLQVNAGKAPLTVSAGAGKATNLDADKLDGQDASAFAPVSGFNAAKAIDTSGPLPRQGTYTSNGGTLIISVAGSGYRGSGGAQRNGQIGMRVTLDGNLAGVATAYTNEQNSHKAFVNDFIVLKGVPAGAHTIGLEALYNFPLNECNTANERDWHYCTTTDSNDAFKVTVVELPA